MKLVSILFGAVLVTSTTHAQTGLTTLSDLRDRARTLLIFAAGPDDPQLNTQLRTLQEHAAETQDRQIVPLAIIYNNQTPTEAKLSAADAQAARRRFGVASNEFKVILLGKDGGEKLRGAKPFSMEKLEETIDAMPMRQEEMTQKKGGM